MIEVSEEIITVNGFVLDSSNAIKIIAPKNRENNGCTEVRMKYCIRSGFHQ